MNEPLSITVFHNGTEREFSAMLQVFGHSHRFVVTVSGTEVIFERDEEGHYRAVLPYGSAAVPVESGLLEAIARIIEDSLA